MYMRFKLLYKPLNDLGTSSNLQAMYKQAEATASFALPLSAFSS